MAVRKQKDIWWIDITHQGKRIRRSTGTKIKAEAIHLHDNIKHNLWQESSLKSIPKKYWMDAVVRWIDESKHKRSLMYDKIHLRWADPFLRNIPLLEITQEHIENIAKAKEDTGVAFASVNRLLEVIRAILRKACNEWGWLHTVPTIRMRKVNNRRIRWLTIQESQRLLQELPSHLQDMAQFTLATGLRESNVTGLQWQDIDLMNRHALIQPEQSKTNKPIPVPLNQKAIELIKNQRGKHPTHVFTYNNKPVTRCNNHAWRKALIRAGIKDFRWHDLRHTWASWHVQNGTSLQELQQLGGWSSFEMVLRYAHLSSKHLQQAAERVNKVIS